MTPLCPEKCYATGGGAQRAIRGEMAALTLFTVDKDGRECVDGNASITGELVCRSDGTVVHCEVVEERNNSYDLQYLPRSQGQHDLHIKVDRTHIRDSPMAVRVVGFRGIHVKTMEGLKGPRRLAIMESGEIVVAERDTENVSVFDSKGDKIQSFGENKACLESPFGVALCNDNTVLVTSCGDYHRVRRFTLDGQFTSSVGARYGRDHLQFNGPWSIATNPTNDKVYVCDKYNHRIQVLNSDFTFSSTIGTGSRGSTLGEFNEPSDVAVNKDGNIFVADSGNNRIQVFSPSGEFIRQFQELGPEMGELEEPTSMCINRETVYVLDCDKRRLSTFDTKGNYIKSYFGTKGGDKPEELNSAYGIAVDKEGYVYISDTGNNRIQIFE